MNPTQAIPLSPYLFGGGGVSTVLANVQGHTPSELRKVIKKEIPDETRQAAALAVVEAWAKSDQTFLDMRFKLKAQFTKTEWDAAVVRLNK